MVTLRSSLAYCGASGLWAESLANATAHWSLRNPTSNKKAKPGTILVATAITV